MPKTSAGKGILGAVLTTVGFVTGNPYLINFGVNMLLAGAAQELADDPRNPENPPNPVKINFNGEEEPLFLVFGQHRVGGHISVLGVSGDENKYLHLGITHSAASPAGMSDITDIWLDENKLDDTIIDGSGDITSGDYAGIVNIRRYLGTDSETADSIFTAAIDYQDSSSFGKGLARTHLRLEKVEDDEAFRKAFPRGVPGITALLEGRCYDPRLDSTNGGTGTQDYADPDTWTFSQNPAVIAGTYLIMEKLDGGWGYDPSEINWTTLAAAANRCDEMVLRPDNAGNGVLVPRHTCNIILDTAEGIRSNLGKILSAMDGTAYTGLDGRVNIVAGQYDVPTTTIDETWVREGEIALNLDTDDDKIYNAVRAKYIEPLVGWQTVDCEPYTNSTYEADDGRQEWKDIQIPATIDRYEAQYLCKIAGRKSRHQRSVTLPLNYKGFDTEFWENVTLDLPDVSGVFKVIKWQFDISGPVVTLLEQTSTAWDDGDGIGDYTIVNPTPPASLVSQTPPTPTGLSATATADGIALTWDPLGSGEYSEVFVYRSSESGGPYTQIKQVRGNWYTDAVADGATYFYKVRARSALGKGVYSAYSDEASATAKAALAGGRGVNVMHPRYSVFSEGRLPPYAGFQATASLTGDVFKKAYGAASLAVAKTAAGSSFIFLTPSGSDYNIELTPGKYILSAHCSKGYANAPFSFRIRVRRSSDDAYRTVIETVADTDFDTRYSGVLDTTTDVDGTAYNVSIWNDGASGDIVYVSAIMIEELAGNQTQPSRFSPPVGAAGDTAVAADEGQIADPVSVPYGITVNGASYLSASLSSTDPGGGARISISSGWSVNISGSVLSGGPAGSINGLSYGTKYYVYADLAPGTLSGASFGATTSETTAKNGKNRAFFGTITTVNAGGGGGSTYTPCVTLETLLADGRCAADVKVGEEMLVHDTDGNASSAEVLRADTYERECFRVTWADDWLDCTASAPLWDGKKYVTPSEAMQLQIERNGKCMIEPVTVEPIGKRLIRHIYVNDQAFLASANGRSFAFHHNAKDPGDL